MEIFIKCNACHVMLFSFSYCELPSNTSGCLILLTLFLWMHRHFMEMIRNVKPLETRNLYKFRKSHSFSHRTKTWSISSVKMHLQKLTLQSDPSEWKLQPIVRIEKMCFCGINCPIAWIVQSYLSKSSIPFNQCWFDLNSEHKKRF